VPNVLLLIPVQEIKHDSSLSPPDNPIIIKYMEDNAAASLVNKGMEKIPNSLDEYLVTSMDTLIFVSPISPANAATWQTIARDSIVHWQNIA
jgi:hypothetical protein